MKYKSRTEYVDAILYNGENWDEVRECLGIPEESDNFERLRWFVYVKDAEGSIYIYSRNQFHKIYESCT